MTEIINYNCDVFHDKSFNKHKFDNDFINKLHTYCISKVKFLVAMYSNKNIINAEITLGTNIKIKLLTKARTSKEFDFEIPQKDYRILIISEKYGKCLCSQNELDKILKYYEKNRTIPEYVFTSNIEETTCLDAYDVMVYLHF